MSFGNVLALSREHYGHRTRSGRGLIPRGRAIGGPTKLHTFEKLFLSLKPPTSHVDASMSGCDVHDNSRRLNADLLAGGADFMGRVMLRFSRATDVARAFACGLGGSCRATLVLGRSVHLSSTRRPEGAGFKAGQVQRRTGSKVDEAKEH